MTLAQLLPNLSALRLWVNKDKNISKDAPTTADIVSFVRQVPNLRLLDLTNTVQLDEFDGDEPDNDVSYKESARPPTLHHLWIHHCHTEATCLDEILKRVGADLRSLVVQEDNDDVSSVLHKINARCPKLQHLRASITSMTDPIAQAISQLKELHTISTPDVLSTADNMLLQSYLHPTTDISAVKVYTFAQDADAPELRFDYVVKQEQIPVDLSPCSRCFTNAT